MKLAYLKIAKLQNPLLAFGHAIGLGLYGIQTTYVRERGYWHSNHASKYEPHFVAQAG